MNTTLKWTPLHKLLFILVLISFLGFIIFLMLTWNQIPDAFNLPFTLGGFGILLIALILIYTIRLRRTMKGPTR